MKKIWIVLVIAIALAGIYIGLNRNKTGFTNSDRSIHVENSTNLTNSKAQSPADDSMPDTEKKKQKLQQIYKKAPKYNHMALAYYEDGFSKEGLVRDGYIPYEENYTQKDINSVYGYAHGVGVRLHIKQGNTALESNRILTSEFVEALKNRNINEITVGDIATFDNNTVVITIVDYVNKQKEEIRAFLYTDIRDNGRAYLCAEIEINPSAFDDKSQALLTEMDEVFAFNMSQLY